MPSAVNVMLKLSNDIEICSAIAVIEMKKHSGLLTYETDFTQLHNDTIVSLRENIRNSFSLFDVIPSAKGRMLAGMIHF